MASFSMASEGTPAFQFRQLNPGIGNGDMAPRGGASLSISLKYGAIIFGGADRGQSHFNDLAFMSRQKREWRKRETKGDVPTPRSGHGTVCYGKFLFLFGGIDFAEEAAYNDLYVLNLETLEWNYVGEAGIEIAARNSHSLGIIHSSHGTNYLVIYGGASPDLGPLGDTYYAVMPDIDVVASSEFFLTWVLLPSSSKSPEPREMHSTSAAPSGGIIIAGGRNEKGCVLSDVWELLADSAAGFSSSSSSSSGSSSSAAGTATGASPEASPGVGDANPTTPPPLRWIQRHDLMLDVPRCAHGAAVLCPSPLGVPYLCVVSGFTGMSGASAMPDDIRMIPMAESAAVDSAVKEAPSSASGWTGTRVSRAIGSRFGVSVCNAASWILSPPLSSLPATSPTKEDAEAGDESGAPIRPSLAEAPGYAEEAAEEGFQGMLLFGGVNAERDFADVWLIHLS